MKQFTQTRLPINKFGNSRVHYDTTANTVISKQTYDDLLDKSTALNFDSCLEFEVYKILRSKFLQTEITHHFSIEILPKTDFDKALKWCVDFRVDHKNYEFFVEAKGIETDDYSLRQRLLRRFRPEVFDRVMTVKKDRLFDFAHRIATFELWEGDANCAKY